MKHDKKHQKAINVVLSIFIAIAIWLYVVNVENPTGTMRLHDVPVTITGSEVLEEQDLMVTSVSRNTITLKLSGKKRTFMKLNRENTSIKADVSFITEPGEHSVSGIPKYPENVSAENVTVINWSDLRLTVTVEKVETRTIPVKGEFIGVLARDCMAGPVSTDPSEILIRGPVSLLDEVSYALVQVGGNEVSQDLVSTETLILMTEDGIPLEDTDLLWTETRQAEVKVPVRQVVSLPLTVAFTGGEAEVSYVIKPDQVTVAKVDGLPDGLSLGEVNLKTISEDTNLELPIPYPEGAALWDSPETAVVSLSLKK